MIENTYVFLYIILYPESDFIREVFRVYLISIDQIMILKFCGWILSPKKVLHTLRYVYLVGSFWKNACLHSIKLAFIGPKALENTQFIITFIYKNKYVFTIMIYQTFVFIREVRSVYLISIDKALTLKICCWSFCPNKEFYTICDALYLAGSDWKAACLYSIKLCFTGPKALEKSQFVFDV